MALLIANTILSLKNLTRDLVPHILSYLTLHEYIESWFKVQFFNHDFAACVLLDPKWFLGKVWISHLESQNCWREIKWFHDRGTQVQWSPYVDSAMYPSEGPQSCSLCHCSRCAYRLRVQESRGTTLSLRAYSGIRRSIIKGPRQRCPSRISRPGFVRDTRRRNNSKAAYHWHDQQEWDENDSNDGSFVGLHSYTNKEIGFARQTCVSRPWPLLEPL